MSDDSDDATAATAGGSRAFVLAFVAASILTLLPLWAVRYPPMVDLPQHAAQIELWRDWDELDPAIAGELELRPLTPYLGLYLLGRLLFGVLPPLPAMKVLASLAFLALPAATLLLLRASDRSRWWVLAAFPVAYSVSASWGLLNFLLATPLAVLLVALASADAREARPRRRLALAAVSLVLLATHGVVAAFALAIAGALALVAATGVRDLVGRALPLVPAGLAGLAWFAATRSGETQVAGNAEWAASPRRLLTLPAELLATEYGPVATAASVGLAILVATAARLRREDGARSAATRDLLLRLVPFVAAAAAYLLGPRHYFLAAFLNRRFAPLVLVFALPLVARGDPARWQRLALLGVLAVASLDLAARAVRFDAEARPMDELLAAMEPGKRVLGLVFGPSTAGLERGSHLVQHVAWAQVEKGGWVDFSFAFFYPQLVGFRDPGRWGYTYVLQWMPERFDPTLHGDYDYFVVRLAGPDPGPVLFRDAPFHWRRVARAGTWWLYERGVAAPATRRR